MALIESCYCCSLLIASVLVGVYVMVAYVIAFTIELWWILETEVTLPAPAYLLCVGYFFVFMQSALLLHGLSVKRTFFLMGWIFVLVIFSFPEAGLVLFMSLYHWELSHLYGLTELTCWVCRVCINIAGLVIVQSLYSQWKEEEEVIYRIQALTMASMVPQRVPMLPNDGTSSLIGYQNDGFVKSTNHINGSLRRPPTSQLGYSPQPSRIKLAPPPPHLNNNVYQPPPTSQHYISPPDFGCEFNAAEFNSLTTTFPQQIFNNLSPETQPSKASAFKRSRSLIDFRSANARGLPNYTQSLDRSNGKLCKKSNSSTNVNDLSDYYQSDVVELTDVCVDQYGRYVLAGGGHTAGYRTLDGRARSMRHAGSGRSLAESDDFQRYSDVAL